MDPIAALARVPQLLRADNLTPPTRTPWGGGRILGRYKAGLNLQVAGDRVGESWEVSVEPSFPSLLQHTPCTLAEAITAAPELWLGAAVAARHGGQTPLLIKLLDTAAALSVQVHPQSDDPDLGAEESGKPEAWIILDADPGAGIYLGFKSGVEREQVRACLDAGGQLDALLNFVAVRAGDAFHITAGTPHAIGPGVTLIEPQMVTPGRRGVTCRFWDWNRRYDAAGCLSPDGALRPLQVQRSLALTDWGAPRGAAAVDACRLSPQTEAVGDIRRDRLNGVSWCEITRWRGSGRFELPAAGTMTALICVGGTAEVTGGGGQIDLRAGRSAVVPAAAGDIAVRGSAMDLFGVHTRV